MHEPVEGNGVANEPVLHVAVLVVGGTHVQPCALHVPISPPAAQCAVQHPLGELSHPHMPGLHESHVSPFG